MWIYTSPNSATDVRLGVFQDANSLQQGQVFKTQRHPPLQNAYFGGESSPGLFPTPVRPCRCHNCCYGHCLHNGVCTLLGLLHHCFIIHVYATHCMTLVEPSSASCMYLYVYSLQLSRITPCDDATQRGRLKRQCQISLLPVTSFINGSGHNNVPLRSLRSGSVELLVVLKTRTTWVKGQKFQRASPHLSNSVPASGQTSTLTDIF